MFSDHGVDIVVDHILHDEYTKQNWFELLGNYPVFYVGINCEVDDIEKRERERGDRIIGQGRSQLSYTHTNMNYDIEINTSKNNPDDCARMIMETLEKKFFQEIDK
jgi:chloramphenicol 3-O phosphotransferase